MMNITELDNVGRDELKDAIVELSDSMTRQSAETELQKNILTEISESLDLDKKLVRKLAKVYYKSTFEQEKEAADQFETAYQEIFKTNA